RAAALRDRDDADLPHLQGGPPLPGDRLLLGIPLVCPQHEPLRTAEAAIGAAGGDERRLPWRRQRVLPAPRGGGMNTAELTRALPRLGVRVGANVKEGQDVYILPADLEHAPLVRALTEEAYLAGARMVSAFWWDPALKRARIEHAPPDSLSLVP